MKGMKFRCHNPRTGETKEDLFLAGNEAEKPELFMELGEMNYLTNVEVRTDVIGEGKACTGMRVRFADSK